MNNIMPAASNEEPRSSEVRQPTQQGVLAHHLAQRTKYLDEYFERTGLLAVIQQFITSLTDQFANDRTVPLNPYAPLLAHARMAEINASRLFMAGGADQEGAASSSLEFRPYAGGDATSLKHAKMLAVEHKVGELLKPTLSHEEKQPMQQKTPSSIWGMQSVLERLPATSNWLKAVQSIRQSFQWWLNDSEHIDEGNRVQAIAALVGYQVFLLGGSISFPATINIERHIVVYSEQLERAMTTFARQLMKALHDLTTMCTSDLTTSSTPAMHTIPLVKCSGLRIIKDPNTIELWPMERVTANRGAFIAAVKSALVSNGSFSAETLHTSSPSSNRQESSLEPQTDNQPHHRQVIRLTSFFFFHFRVVDETSVEASTSTASSSTSKRQRPGKTKTPPTLDRSFLSGSQISTSGIFSQPQSALKIVLGLQTATSHSQQSDRKSEVKADRGTCLTELFVHLILDHTRTPINCRSWLSECATMTAHRLANIESNTTILTAALRESKSITAMADKVTFLSHIDDSLCGLQQTLNRLVQDANIGAVSSNLLGLQGIMRDCFSLPSLGQFTGETSQADAFDGDDDTLDARVDLALDTLTRIALLVRILASAAMQDLFRLIRTTSRQCDVETWPLVDLQADIDCAGRQRRYPEAIAAEAVFAQYLTDSSIDVALESAVTNTVAFCLPPNPFVILTTHIRSFASRHYAGSYRLPCKQNQSGKLGCNVVVSEGKWFVGEGGFKIIAANERLLQIVAVPIVADLQQWLQKQQIHRQTEYQPSKASYSVRIDTSLLLIRPLEFTRTSHDPSESLYQTINVMEHITIEGKEREQSISFFVDAVQGDIQRLRALQRPGYGHFPANRPEIRLIDPLGKLVSIVVLEDVATFGQLIREATDTQCTVEIAMHSTALQADGLVVRCVTKSYSFHYVATANASGGKAHPMNSNSLSAIMVARLWRYAIFFSRTAINTVFAGVTSPPTILPSDWACYASRAVRRRDLLALYQLHLGDPQPDVTPSQPGSKLGNSFLHYIVFQSPLLPLLEMETTLEWLVDQLSIANHTVDAELPPNVASMLTRLTSLMDIHVLPLALQMGYVDAALVTTQTTLLRALLSSGSSSQLTVRATLPVTQDLWTLVVVVRFAHGYDVFSNISSKLAR